LEITEIGEWKRSPYTMKDFKLQVTIDGKGVNVDREGLRKLLGIDKPKKKPRKTPKKQVKKDGK